MIAWGIAIALLAAALAGAITVAVHYRSEVATLKRRLPVATGRHFPSAGPVTLATTAVRLPSRGTLSAGVTILTAKSARGLAQIELSVHISGARQHTAYALIAFNCAGSSGYQTWAAGVTNARGSGTLSGQAMSVSPGNEYWLYVSPSSSGGSSEAGVLGGFTASGTFSASPAGDPACS